MWTTPEPRKYETKRIFLPTPEVIMAFSKDDVNALPNYYDLDNIKVGGFAKKGWLKAGNSLVFIMGIDGNTVYWTWANAFNGYISADGWASNVKRWESIAGSGWTVYSENRQSNAFLIKN